MKGPILPKDILIVGQVDYRRYGSGAYPPPVSRGPTTGRRRRRPPTSEAFTSSAGTLRLVVVTTTPSLSVPSVGNSSRRGGA